VDKTYEYPAPVKRPRTTKLTYERKFEIVNLWLQHPKWSWKTLKRQGCPEIPNESTLYRWRRQAISGKSTLDKVRETAQFN